MFDHRDGGYKSRKMVMTYVVMGLGTFGYLVTGHWPALVTVFPEYCAFLIGTSAVFTGANTAIKWMSSKLSPPAEAADGEDPK
jgi:hypothetical protein